MGRGRRGVGEGAVDCLCQDCNKWFFVLTTNDPEGGRGYAKQRAQIVGWVRDVSGEACFVVSLEHSDETCDAGGSELGFA